MTGLAVLATLGVLVLAIFARWRFSPWGLRHPWSGCSKKPQ